MQFYYPEVLYALVLLIIPILVHLFQLRRFQTEYFTNVKFLKKISLQTRKSSRIKKWLILTTRLLALASIIVAFAQPYIPSEKNENSSIETVIYLDNSFSMEAIGKKGRLLERSVQELLESDLINKNTNLFTNSEEYRAITVQDLQNITYTGEQLDYKTILLKAKTLFTKDTSVNKKLLIISDLQKTTSPQSPQDSSTLAIYAYKQSAERKENLQIDTAYISQESIDSKVLQVEISNSGTASQTTPVSIYNNEILLGKSSATLAPAASLKLSFPLSEDEIKQGKIVIEDNSLEYDNILYFSLNTIAPIKVCSIDKEITTFLGRIFNAPEFEFTSMPGSAINYTALNNANVIIVNELQEISSVLNTTLLKLASENRTIILIPSSTNLGDTYGSFIKNSGFSGIDSVTTKEKFITNIKFQHPLYKGVFENQVQNFEYPKIQKSYSISSRSNSILEFEDKSPFLVKSKNTYFFTGALNLKNSNFIQSPLVVPTFYKMALSNRSPPLLYHNLAEENKISLPISVKNDEVVKIDSKDFSFIPQQRNYEERVEITTLELPNLAGNYSVSGDEAITFALSYNVNRAESNLKYLDISEIKNVRTVEGLDDFFNSEGYQTKKDTFWKWFVTFALLFLLIETLLLKYFK